MFVGIAQVLAERGEKPFLMWLWGGSDLTVSQGGSQRHVSAAAARSRFAREQARRQFSHCALKV